MGMVIFDFFIFLLAIEKWAMQKCLIHDEIKEFLFI